MTKSLKEKVARDCCQPVYVASAEDIGGHDLGGCLPPQTERSPRRAKVKVLGSETRILWVLSREIIGHQIENPPLSRF